MALDLGQDPFAVLRLGRSDFLLWALMAMRTQKARADRDQILNSNLAVEIVNNLGRAFKSK